MNKKKIFFLVQILFLMFFCSQVFAGVELIENTDQCLSECKAVLRVSGLPASVSVASSPNAQFKIDFVKSATANDLSSYDLNVCYYKDINKQIPVYDYNRFVVSVDVNGDSVYDTNTVFKGFKGVWEKVYDCNNFFGSVLRKDLNYDVVLTGRRNPVLLQDKNNAVDWQLTFGGVVYKQWAWWNSSWRNKVPITICADVADGKRVDLNKNDLIWLRNVDWTDYAVKANLQDVRIVDENVNEELARFVEGTSTSIDGNLFFRLRNPLNANNCATSVYYMYYNNSAATYAQSPLNAVENWDDSPITALPYRGWTVWNSSGVYTGGNKFLVSTEHYKSSPNAVFIDNNSGESDPPYYIKRDYNLSSPNFYDDLNGRTIDVNFWVYVGKLDDTKESSVYIGDASKYDAIRITLANNAFAGCSGQCIGDVFVNSPVDVNWLFVFDANTWYKINVRMLLGTNYHTACVSKTDANVVCNTQENRGSVWDKIPTQIRFTVNSNTAGDSIWVDDIDFFAPFDSNISLGQQQGKMDVNFLSQRIVDANTYWKGGQVLNLDFNVRKLDANAVDLNFDLNYSQSRVEGTGTEIINDGNVATTVGLFCDTNDLARGDGFGSTACHYTWTTPTIFDGNTFLILKVVSATDSNIVYSDYNFYLDNNSPVAICSDCNTSWQRDANIHLDCNDTSGDFNFAYRLDTDFLDTNNMADWNYLPSRDTNTRISVDGNWQIDFYCVDKSGRRTDLNFSNVVLIDLTTPFLSAKSPDSNSNTTSTTPTLSCNFDDNKSGLNICGGIWYKNNTAQAYLTLTPVSGSCTYNPSGLAVGDIVFLDCNAQDNKANTTNGSGYVAASYFRTGAYTITSTPPAGDGGTGGGGGGGGGEINIVVPSLVQLTTNTDVISLFVGQENTWKITVLSLSDSDIPIKFELPDSLQRFLIKQQFCESVLTCSDLTGNEILKANSTGYWNYTFKIPVDTNSFEDFSDKVLVNLNSGQEYTELSLTLQYSNTIPFYLQEVFGLPVWILLTIFVFVVVAWWGSKNL